MSVLELYKKLAGSATAVGQSQKTKDKLADKAGTQQSPNLEKATSATGASPFAPKPGMATLEEQNFLAAKK